MKIFISANLSCSLNYEQNLIKEKLKEKHELTNNPNDADIIVIASSCATTKKHINQTLNYIKYLKRMKKPSTKIFLTGCITREHINDPYLNKVTNYLKENVDYIIPKDKPYTLTSLIEREKEEKNPVGFKEDGIQIRNIYITNGCLNKCSFCKTTFQNYPLISADLETVKKYIKESPSSRINLIGTNLCQYGYDKEGHFLLPKLLEFIEGQDRIEKVYLTGFSFKDAINLGFNHSIKNSKKTGHICGSLESGSDKLLELMKKGFTKEEFLRFTQDIKEKYPKDLDLNIISGFPTENTQDIKETIDALKIVNPINVNICKYINSPFVGSNDYRQLTRYEINKHTKTYQRALTKEGIRNKIV